MSVLLDKPSACYESGCPLAACVCGHALSDHGQGDEACIACAHIALGEKSACSGFRAKGKGFVLGCGDPKTAQIAMILEAPGKDEVEFGLGRAVPGRQFYETAAEIDAEVARRRVAYPEVEERLLRKGVPLVGKSGIELEMWVMPNAGVRRAGMFIDNTIRCLPPKTKQGAYPKGDERKAAEKACRVYDRIEQFRPDVAIVSLHPAGILHEVTPLPLQIEDMKKARDFVRAGRRPMMLIGGKAAKAFLRCCENVTRFRGAYFWLKEKWTQTYRGLFEYENKASRKAATKRKKSVAAKAAHVEALFDLADVRKLKKPRVRRTKKEKAA